MKSYVSALTMQDGKRLQITHNERMIKNIIEWAAERGLEDAPKIENDKQQYFKFLEEFGEYNEAVIKDNKYLIIDSIGDMGVVAIVRMLQLGLDPIEIINAHDYDEFEKNATDYYEFYDSSYFEIVASITKTIYEIEWELHFEHTYDNMQATKPHFSHLFLLLSWLSAYHDTTLDFCLAHAYSEIKDRKGEMVDGTFIKEEDNEIHEIVGDIELYNRLSEHNRQVYIDKNKKYGNSFSETVQSLGRIAAVTRIHDKFARIKHNAVNDIDDDANLLDDILDLANYCYLYGMEVVNDNKDSQDNRFKKFIR